MRCNLSDLAPECPNPYETRFFPERILLYDQHPGGTGVSKQVRIVVLKSCLTVSQKMSGSLFLLEDFEACCCHFELKFEIISFSKSAKAWNC